jgi:hypothetical protein
MSLLYAVDPGTIQSALVMIEPGGPNGIIIRGHQTLLNGALLTMLARLRSPHDTLVIEEIQSMGMAVGQDVFTTVWWAGRFYEAWQHAHRYQLPRRPIKLHLCGNMQAKDSNIRTALMDKFGGADAIGVKARQGPLYGVKGHEFAALAVAVTWLETHGAPTAASAAHA